LKSKIRCDPTWNHPARTLLVYVLPLGLLTFCLHQGWVGASRDFWVPFLWGAIVPTWNTRRAAGRPWALTSYMNRDGYPLLGMSLVHATFWCTSANLLPNATLAVVAFVISFLAFDALMLRYRILRLYAIPLSVHKRGKLAVLLGFAPGWWIYLGTGLALSHRFGTDTILSIALWTLGIIAPAQVVLTWFGTRRTAPERLEGKKRVAVIGGGWAGLYAMKWLKEVGLEPVCFEATDDIGGVWRYRGDRPGGVFRGTRATSSKHFLHASDFPLPAGLADFPHHSEIMTYLRRYAAHFGLLEHVRLSTSVDRVERVADGWRVATTDDAGRSDEHSFDAVMVCSGPQGIPRLDPETDPLYSRFDGPVEHAENYKHADDTKPGEKLLVVGAGESAADMVAELVEAGAEVHWSTHRGQWFADRNIGPYAADHFTSFGFRALFGRFLMVEYVIRRFIIAGFINLSWGRGGHGVTPWIPRTPYLHQFLNKSRDGILEIYRGKVRPHGTVKGIQAREVTFSDEGEPVEFDRILLCTGYRPHWRFLSKQPRVSRRDACALGRPRVLREGDAPEPGAAGRRDLDGPGGPGATFPGLEPDRCSDRPGDPRQRDRRVHRDPGALAQASVHGPFGALGDAVVAVDRVQVPAERSRPREATPGRREHPPRDATGAPPGAHAVVAVRHRRAALRGGSRHGPRAASPEARHGRTGGPAVRRRAVLPVDRHEAAAAAGDRGAARADSRVGRAGSDLERVHASDPRRNCVYRSRGGKPMKKILSTLVVVCAGVAIGAGLIAISGPAEAAPPEPCRCIPVFEPVICNGNRVFSNQCQADCAKAKDCQPRPGSVIGPNGQ
jgi:dimethylaniline monooxygenase (N-oxide forming)